MTTFAERGVTVPFPHGLAYDSAFLRPQNADWSVKQPVTTFRPSRSEVLAVKVQF